MSESIAKIWGFFISAGITGESMHVDDVGGQEKEGQECLRSTPVKTVSGKSYVVDCVKFLKE